MKIYNNFVKIDEPIALTIGTYDAIHKGHIEIILNMKKFGLKTCVVFYPPPFIYFGIENKVLFTLEEKVKIFEELSIDNLILIQFDEKIENLKSEEFIKILVSNLYLKYLIVGKTFRFGKNKEGDSKELEKLSLKYNFKLELIEEKKIGNCKISSSKIRDLIKNGDIENANKYLYRNYFIITKRENDIFIIDKLKLLPPDGEYLVNIEKNYKESIIKIKNRELKIEGIRDQNKISIEFIKRLK